MRGRRATMNCPAAQRGHIGPPHLDIRPARDAGGMEDAGVSGEARGYNRADVLRSPCANCGTEGETGLGAFLEQAFEVKTPVAEGEVAFRVPRPFLLGSVPGKLEAVPVGVPQVESLVGAMVVVAVERPVSRDQPAKGVA